MNGTHVWRGEDGAPYEFRIYGLDTNWNDVPGNYIFAKRSGAGWIALYIGQTSSFKNRLSPSHEHWNRALQHGMTYIHAHTGSEYERTRRYEEWNLIRRHMPVVNQTAAG